MVSIGPILEIQLETGTLYGWGTFKCGPTMDTRFAKTLPLVWDIPPSNLYYGTTKSTLLTFFRPPNFKKLVSNKGPIIFLVGQAYLYSTFYLRFFEPPLTTHTVSGTDNH